MSDTPSRRQEKQDTISKPLFKRPHETSEGASKDRERAPDRQPKQELDAISDWDWVVQNTPKASDMVDAEMIRVCSSDMKVATGTTMKDAVAGTAFKFRNRGSAAVTVLSLGDEAALFRDRILIDREFRFKTMTLTVGAGTYDVLVCDQRYLATCEFGYAPGWDPPANCVSELCLFDLMFHPIIDPRFFFGKWTKGTIGYLPGVTVATDGKLATSAAHPAIMVIDDFTGSALGGKASHEIACELLYSPLIVHLSETSMTFLPPRPGVRFDIAGDGVKYRLSWPADATSYFIVLDRNGNSSIDDVNEMFGNNTVGPDGKKADNGFLALGKYDLDANGLIDEGDKVFDELRFWRDFDHDGVTDDGELWGPKDLGLSHIDLAFEVIHESDQYGNESRQRSVVGMADGVLRPVFDVWFAEQ